MFTGYLAIMIVSIAMIFLPTVAIALITYPHYNKLDLEEKRNWIKEWGTTRIPNGLILIIIVTVSYPFASVLSMTGLIDPIITILFLLMVGMIFMVYYNWIKMITPSEKESDQ